MCAMSFVMVLMLRVRRVSNLLFMHPDELDSSFLGFHIVWIALSLLFTFLNRHSR